MKDPRAVFASDVHLRFGDRPYLDRFVAFLRATPGLAGAVYLHGDLFDFYVGPKQGRLPFYAPLFAAIADLASKGVAVHVQHGNRDYLTGADFEAVGATILPDEAALDLGGRRVHLSHGDQFCVHDLSYQRAKRVLRWGPMTAFTKALPTACSILAARLYRRVSARKARRAKKRVGGRLSTILDGVQALVDREPFDVVIAGHIHHFAETPLRGRAGAVRLITTGAWDEWGEGPNYVHFDGDDLRLKRFAP